jgi:transcription-repair coupling factor (superfamily II helicase)
VSHKEAIKALQSQIDVLALSATPIPRSLNMALSGLRSVSQITTPPQKKKAIESRLLAYSDEACIIACQRELDRQGQVLVIESRIARLQKQETFLLKRLTVKD